MKNLGDLGVPLGRLPCQIKFRGEEHGLTDQLPGFKSYFQYSKTENQFCFIMFLFFNIKKVMIPNLDVCHGSEINQYM